MLYLTRREHFNGAHRLYNPQWTEAQNVAVFGKCSNAHFHGHNFELYVTVKGTPNPDTGFVMNAHDLSRIIKREVTDKLDHKNFNLDVPEFEGILPSCENVIVQIWQWLLPHITDCTLHSLRLVETENIFVEYYG
jgi:6-pyruvoyltetrahydropterin/6-carboxytetrahydropterin synthase